MSSTANEGQRGFWVQVSEAQARIITSAALLTALHCRGARTPALQPLASAFSLRLSERCGQQLCCARPSCGPLPPVQATNSGAANSVPHTSVFTSANPSPVGLVTNALRALRETPPRVPDLPRLMRSSKPTASTGLSSRAASSWSSGPAAAPSRGGMRCTGGFRAANHGAASGSAPYTTAGQTPFTASSPLCVGSRSGGSSYRSPNLFRSFAASAVRPPPVASGRCYSHTAAAAATAARHTRSGWNASQAYLSNVQKSVLETMAPYWGSLSWVALVALYKQSHAYAWGLPSVRQLHFFLLNAINVLANNLPVTLALTVAEIARNSRSARADTFSFYLDVPTADPSDRPWWQALPLQMAALLVNMGRSLWLLLLFAPVLLSAPVALQLQFRRAEWIELLRKTLEAAGPAFIKWGQWAATRHDLFPPDMCSELEKLHTQAPGHSFRYTQAAIEQAFAVPMAELFESIDRQPVASGSIGQIHRAVLSHKGAAMTGVPPGSTVAVKVRHPGVDAAILRDFTTMMAVAHLASMLPSLKHLRLEQTLSQFAAPLREQVDLSREAANLRRFNHNFRKTSHVSFPVPLYPLVTPDVLVETFEMGEHITAYIQSEHNPYNHRLSELGSGTMLQMMLVDNLIHSDLHPGNILVRLDPPGGLLGLLYSGLDKIRQLPSIAPANRARIELLQQRWLQPSLVLLDVGMATELSPTDQVNMVGLFRSFAAMDGRACGDWTLRFSGDAQSCPDPEAFRVAMQEAFEELHKMDVVAAGGQGEEACSFKNGADALASVLELVRQHQVSLPGHICAVVVTTLVLEGWSNKLDPDHSVLSQVQAMFEPVNVAWAHRITQLVDRVMEEEANHFALA
ncbi:hypothetical protein Vretimale_1497 [Volvox reticuliferus]|uniref:ABC1 atypical kinase-like domain-containing protein n=2 Tax=Volvox reticuliferus TaxID=1737510 RepID=A0A8J4D9B7_9CHLO|nr:hypothetical protein Vretifemale_10685 [Volvox reticuliferus]GIL95478.1 hypothetical protein Vretimale_1497 [Volvox reticuliferus]